MLDTYFLSNKFWLHLELFGFITGLTYIYFELKQKASMWVIGSISSAVYVVIFAFAKIYADMCFNFYNLIIGIYGLTLWIKHSNEKFNNETGDKESIINYHHISKSRIINLGFLSIVLYLAIYYLLVTFTDSPVAYGDAFTTTVSIIAVYLLAKKVIEQWILWFIVNITSIFLYHSRGLDITMILYMVYTICSIYGYYYWRKNGILITKDKTELITQ